MRHLPTIMRVMIAVLLLAPLAPARAEPPAEIHNARDPVPQGHGFCFQSALVFGNIVILGNRCYTFYLVRADAGIFLGFGPPGPPMVPPGQLVRIYTPAGAKIKGRLFYLVPLSVPGTVLPVNAIQFVNVRVTGQPGRLVMTVPIAERAVELVFTQR